MYSPMNHSLYKEEETEIRQRYARREVLERGNLYNWLKKDVAIQKFRLSCIIPDILSKIGKTNLYDLEILDVGCGSGNWLRTFIEWGARPSKLHGIDLLDYRIDMARDISCGKIDFQVASAWPIPFSDNYMDFVSAFTVFSSILDPAARKSLADEMLRVVKPDGLILIYDFRISHPNNQDTVGIPLYEIRRLFPGKKIKSRLETLAPPISRLLARYSPWLSLTIELVFPILRTHRIYQISKKK